MSDETNETTPSTPDRPSRDDRRDRGPRPTQPIAEPPKPTQLPAEQEDDGTQVELMTVRASTSGEWTSESGANYVLSGGQPIVVTKAIGDEMVAASVATDLADEVEEEPTDEEA